MNSERAQKIYKIIMLIIITALVTFILTTVGLYNTFGGLNVKYISSGKSDIGEKISYYKQFIEKNYIYDFDENKMMDSAIKGYFEGLDDEYCEYITKEEMEEYMADATGKYVGIGVYIANDREKNQIVVLMPIKGSPAEEAGIKAGDIILAVDGIEYSGEQLSEASSRLKTEDGTKAKIKILRDNETLELEVERREIKVNHIESKVLQNNIGYINISSFDDGTYKEFKEQYDSLKQQNIKSLIIDLRNNGGGIVEESTDIADMFVEKGKTLLITKEKNKEEEITKAKNDKEIDIPVVILVNENTASASEILTLAIKENTENIKVVGTKTYGKGVIQSIFTLKDKSGIKLTTAEYFSPNHNSINKIGIEPDYEVELPEKTSLYLIEEKDDTQLQKAIEILK